MKGRWILTSVLTLGLLVVLTGSSGTAQEQVSGASMGTAFTYQGRLTGAGGAIDGACDLRFRLYDTTSGGDQIGSTEIKTGVAVSDGLFTVQLDYGADAFAGDARWLDIEVRCPAGVGKYASLTPRQALTPAPYALYALATGGGGDSWSLAGNAGTDPGRNFLGTTDNKALELHVNGERALRIDPAGDSVNVVGGSYVNTVGAGVEGATVAGGGAEEGCGDTGDPCINSVNADYGTIGGGRDNQVSGSYATIGGGEENEASGNNATVSGGFGNSTSASGAVVGGGSNNIARGSGTTISGGVSNRASGQQATIGGGSGNSAGGRFASVGGGEDNAADTEHATTAGGTSNTASGEAAAIGGGARNRASGLNAVIGGGTGNIADGYIATVAGGGGNKASYIGTVGGGAWNVATGQRATIGGGESNTADGFHATIGGGMANEAGGKGATIAGGGALKGCGERGEESCGNIVTSEMGTVGGGGGHTVTGERATIGGGNENSASGSSATVGGGAFNVASASIATVAGGGGNRASGDGAFVGGGQSNTARATHSTVAGGAFNDATGDYAMVPGGEDNLAEGDYSFAAGRRAKAEERGCFVWGDSQDSDVACSDHNEWVARATGGVFFYTNKNLTSGVKVGAGGNSWSTASDRALKENLQEIDYVAFLDNLIAEVPVTTWTYRSEGPSVRHIGPMAQDFSGALGLGGDQGYIATVDADGAALAAIHGLYAQNQALTGENVALQGQVEDLAARLADLEALVAGMTEVGTGGEP